MSGLDTRARAKLNLSLDVLARRPDGFHDLRMVMQAAALADEVHVELREPGFFRAETNRSYIPTDERNIAVKAAKAYFEAAGIDSGAYIKITKRIPVCAGLGGGSSDAAAVIRALGELTGAPLEGGELCAAALRAGSDVPFCLMGGTALATGRGEVLARRMYNVFEDALDRRAAQSVGEIKRCLLDNGALGAVMSGSGSAVYGLFPNRETASAAADAAKNLCREVFLTETV